MDRRTARQSSAPLTPDSVLQTPPPRAGGRTLNRTGTRFASSPRRVKTRRALANRTERSTAQLRHGVDGDASAPTAHAAADVLNELPSPLTQLASDLLFIRNRADALRPDDLRAALDLCIGHVKQMRQLVGSLEGFGGQPTPNYVIADIHDIIRDAISVVSEDLERQCVRLTLSAAPMLVRCDLDVGIMRQVLINLLRNAIEAMPHGGAITVRTSVRNGRPAAVPVVLIQIGDSGVGISSADLRRVFRPRYSTKRGGIGLGLPFCRQAVDEHGGQIRITSPGIDQGTVVTVSIPARSCRPIADKHLRVRKLA